MKRCPECQFLYYDEQERCDMDGTRLRYTTFLPPLARPPHSGTNSQQFGWGGFTIPLLALVVIGSVVLTLYRATPPKFSSSSGAGPQPAATNQDTKLPASESPRLETTPVIREKATDPFALPETRARNNAVQSPVESTNEKRLTIEPATRVLIAPPSPVMNAPKPATVQTSPSPISQKAAATGNTIPVHPLPAAGKPTPQSKTQNQDNDSKFKSLFKKAKRVFKNPF